MRSDATTAELDLMTIQEVADWLKVAKSTVEIWVYGKDLASFRKGKVRKIERHDVIRFVALNTIKPRRPDWLTAPLENEFRKLLTEIVSSEVRQAMEQKAA
jgi:excisionase family DNA binding protein